jgi:hypothetical protein
MPTRSISSIFDPGKMAARSGLAGANDCKRWPTHTVGGLLGGVLGFVTLTRCVALRKAQMQVMKVATISDLHVYAIAKSANVRAFSHKSNVRE